MSGIVFFKTQMLDKLKEFYINRIGCQLWVEQHDCILLKHGNLIFGFCQRERASLDALITFFYDTREEVDECYGKFKEIAIGPPSLSEKYKVYQFYARDPEGRMLEFQYFDHHVDQYRLGDEILLTRRSIRKFKDENIPDEHIHKIIDICRFAPTSMNRQGSYYKIIRDKEIQKKISEVRGSSSQPINNSPLAVAICSDPGITKRPDQDGCIAATYFILTAWHFGLGTCWIAAMDRDDVKEMLNIPSDHYVATITPLGYPEQFPVKIPERKELSSYIRE